MSSFEGLNQCFQCFRPTQDRFAVYLSFKMIQTLVGFPPSSKYFLKANILNSEHAGQSFKWVLQPFSERMSFVENTSILVYSVTELK